MPVQSRVFLVGALSLSLAWTACTSLAPTPASKTSTAIPATAQPQLSSGAIERFFAHASEPTCTPARDQLEYTTQTIRCVFADGGARYSVDYNEWFSEPAWWDGMNQLRSVKDVRVDETWKDTADEGVHGTYIAWIELGQVVLMWGVDGRPLSGTMYWHDTNLGTAIHAFNAYARKSLTE